MPSHIELNKVNLKWLKNLDVEFKNGTICKQIIYLTDKLKKQTEK